MKKIFLIITMVLTGSCFSQNVIKVEDLEFKICNKFIKDNSDIKMKLINNSLKDYYFHVDTSIVYEPMVFFGYFLHNIYLKLEDQNNNEIVNEIVDNQCYDEPYYMYVKKKLLVKDILKVKSKETVYFKIPFRMKTTINDYCWYGYQREKMNDKNKYFVSFQYKIFPDFEKTLTPYPIQDSLTKMGYESYNKEIISNKVLLIFK